MAPGQKSAPFLGSFSGQRESWNLGGLGGQPHFHRPFRGRSPIDHSIAWLCEPFSSSGSLRTSGSKQQNGVSGFYWWLVRKLQSANWGFICHSCIYYMILFDIICAYYMYNVHYTYYIILYTHTRCKIYARYILILCVYSIHMIYLNVHRFINYNHKL